MNANYVQKVVTGVLPATSNGILLVSMQYRNLVEATLNPIPHPYRVNVFGDRIKGHGNDPGQ